MHFGCRRRAYDIDKRSTGRTSIFL
jgi:hypothetical protein